MAFFAIFFGTMMDASTLSAERRDVATKILLLNIQSRTRRHRIRRLLMKGDIK